MTEPSALAAEAVLVTSAEVVLPEGVARQRAARVPQECLPRAVAEPVQPFPVPVTETAGRTAVTAVRRFDQAAKFLRLLRVHQEQQLSITHLDLPLRCRNQPHPPDRRATLPGQAGWRELALHS